MATVAAPQVARKVYRAHLDETPGMLGKVNDRILFIADDTNEMTFIEGEHINFLVVLGEMGLADAQAAADRIAGGYAAIACNRRQEAA